MNAVAATNVTSATNASATAKCAVTHQGFRSVFTTIPPSTACPNTSGTAANAGQSSAFTDRKSRHAKYAVPTTRIEETKTRNRWENSIREWIVPAGKS